MCKYLVHDDEQTIKIKELLDWIDQIVFCLQNFDYSVEQEELMIKALDKISIKIDVLWNKENQ
ncbi:MAG: hypothetical protein ACR2M6_02685 [Vampirovibrionia bacterium]